METRTIILFLLGLTISRTLCASIPVHVHIEDGDSSADVDIPVNIDETVDDVVRTKRSGSPDFFGYIKKGITSKIAQFAQASAGSSAHFSKGSSSGGGGGGGYYYPAPHDDTPSYGTKSLDFWTLKKSILNTLLQAVKAINGGIIAVKGQLIKGGGALISAKGRFISMKGEALTNVGKHIIVNSKLSPSKFHSQPQPEYSAPSGHSGPSAIAHPSPSYGPPPSEYGPPSSPGAPSASAPTAGFPDHPPSTYGAPTVSAYGPPIGPSGSAAPSHAYLPQKVTGYDGIVLLKKIPKVTDFTASALASLPLQDERHKVVKPMVDVTKTPLFSPEAPKTTPFQPPAPVHEEHSYFESAQPPKSIYGSPVSGPPSGGSAHVEHSAPYFESAIKSIKPPKAIYGAPINASPSGESANIEHGTPVFPTASSYISPHHSSATSPPGSVDESLLNSHSEHGYQPDFNIHNPVSQYHGENPSPVELKVQNIYPNIHKPLSQYHNEKPPPVELKVQNIYQNSGNLYNSKIPNDSHLDGHSSHGNYGVQQPEFNIHKPLSDYNTDHHPEVAIKGIQNTFNNNGNYYLSKIPAPFEINSFGGDHHLSNFGLGASNNIHTNHDSFSGSVKTNFQGALDNYAPAFSNLGLTGTDLSSNLQYKEGILEHKGTVPLPEYDVVKSVSYELPAHKRQ